MRKLRVFSTFDGISGGQIALERAGIPVEIYYASEINKDAIAVTQHNYPNTIQLGDITKLDGKPYKGKIDLFIGGSSCQSLSIAQANRKEFKGESGLFYEYVRLLKEIEPKYFLLENVYSMSDEAREEITRHMGVQPIMINSQLVSSQNRRRYYWTNIPNVTQPENMGIKLQDILESGYADREKGLCIARRYAGFVGSQSYLCRRYFGKSFGQAVFTSKEDRDTIRLKWQENPYFEDDELPHKMIRPMSCLECERLQTLPPGYTACISSNIARKEAIGNGWTINVIAHIFKNLKEVDEFKD